MHNNFLLLNHVLDVCGKNRIGFHFLQLFKLLLHFYLLSVAVTQ